MKAELFSLVSIGQVFELDGMQYRKVDRFSARLVADGNDTGVVNRFHADAVVVIDSSRDDEEASP